MHKNERHPLRVSRALLVITLAATVLPIGERLVSSASMREASSRVARPAIVQTYMRPASIPYPAANSFSAARAGLGRQLFFDPRLSGSQDTSCASCHNPGFSWTDPLPLAIGHDGRLLGRRTPTVLNLAWAPALFWDGRAESLEQQALGPIAAPGEMNLPLDRMVERLNRIPGYRPLFERAYPGEGISAATVSKAIATFERGVVSGTSPFDRWLSGEDAAISADAKRGFEVFNGKGRCSECHSGWRFTDDSFHDIGVSGSDLGRGPLMPGFELLQSAFKTPTLRNIAERAPYFHNGSAATLEEVVDLYDKGGLVQRASLAEEVRPLHLTAAERTELVAFMRTLSSRDPAVQVPVLPR